MMFITGDPIEKTISIQSMSVSDIDKLMAALKNVREQSLGNLAIVKKEIENHTPSEAELAGAVGYHPAKGYATAEADININDDGMRLQFSSLRAVDLYSDALYDTEEIKKEIGLISKRENEFDIDGLPNEYEVQSAMPSKDSKKVVNLRKANLLIEKMYKEDSEYLYSANIDWKPFGGTYVAHIMDRYFLAEINLYGVSAKEVSKEFYDCFLEEFGKNL